MRANSNATSWTRRYALVRGQFLFYFVTASSFGADRPEGVLPLENSEIQVCRCCWWHACGMLGDMYPT